MLFKRRLGSGAFVVVAVDDDMLGEEAQVRSGRKGVVSVSGGGSVCVCGTAAVAFVGGVGRVKPEMILRGVLLLLLLCVGLWVLESVVSVLMLRGLGSGPE